MAFDVENLFLKSEFGTFNSSALCLFKKNTIISFESIDFGHKGEQDSQIWMPDI